MCVSGLLGALLPLVSSFLSPGDAALTSCLSALLFYLLAPPMWWWRGWCGGGGTLHYTTLHWASLQFFGDSAFSLVTTTVPLRRKRSHFSASARFYSLSSFCCELIFSELILLLLLLLRFPFPLLSTDARTHTFDRSFVRSFVMT